MAKHPPTIRYAGNIYELVQTEAPAAGGSNLKKMHRAVDDDDDDYKEPVYFHEVPKDERPTMEQIESSSRVLAKQLVKLREAFDSKKFEVWDATFEEYVRVLAQLKRNTSDEFRRLHGKHHWLL